MKTTEANFKQWVTSHNPQETWNWDDPVQLKYQLMQAFKQSGDIDLKSLFILFFQNDDPGLSLDQNEKFIKMYY